MKIIFLFLALTLVKTLKLDVRLENLKDLPKNAHTQIIINHHNSKDVDNTFILMISKKITLNQWKHKISRYKQKHIILLLLLAGDIESNPGPTKSNKDKCTICNKRCTMKQRAIQCDTCDNWYHASCLHMNTPIYIALGNKDASWHCLQCGLPQFSSGLFESYDLDITNPYNALTNPNINTEMLDLNKPLAFSTPIKEFKKVPAARTKIHKYGKIKSPNNHKTLIINFQSIKNKTADLEVILYKENPDIISGSETWLNPNIHSSEIFNSNYEIFRKDRSDKHGGVLLAIKSSLIAEEIIIEPKTNVESVFCKISRHNSPPLIVGSIYRPPNSNIEYMTDLCNQLINLKEKNKNAVIWITGDFNLPDINWETHAIEKHQNTKEINELFIETIENLNLEQIIKKPTRQNNILDLFLSNRPGLVVDYEIIPGISDHDIVRVNNTIKAQISKKPNRIVYQWNRCNIIKLHQSALNFQNNFLNKYKVDDPVEETWNYIKTNLKEIMEDSVPKKQISNKINKCWFNSKLKKLCKQKENLF